MKVKGKRIKVKEDRRQKTGGEEGSSKQKGQLTTDKEEKERCV